MICKECEINKTVTDNNASNWKKNYTDNGKC